MDPKAEAGSMDFTDMEIDIIGEILNISMGSAATALSSMLDKQVLITTPKVVVEEVNRIDCSKLEPAMMVKITYDRGITGSNIMVFRQKDMQYILTQLMGNEGPLRDDYVFDDLSISAACEVMNQMMGSSATALSEFLGRTIAISTPTAFIMDEENTFEHAVGTDIRECVVAVFFNLSIEDVVKSEFVCVMKSDLAHAIVSQFVKSEPVPEKPAAQPQVQAERVPEQPAAQPQARPEPAPGQPAAQPQVQAERAPEQPVAQPQVQAERVPEQPPTKPQAQPVSAPVQQGVYSQSPGSGVVPGDPYAQGQAPQAPAYPPQAQDYQGIPFRQGAQYPPQYQYPPQNIQQYAYPGYPPQMVPQLGQQPASYGHSGINGNSIDGLMGPSGLNDPADRQQNADPNENAVIKQAVNVRNVQFPTFSVQQQLMFSEPLTSGNIDMLMNIPLNVSIEIGRTKKKIKDIMDFNQGSIIELEKQAGAPVDIIVNGQLMARGDVVVIDDNFAVRITEIVGTKEIIGSADGTAGKV